MNIFFRKRILFIVFLFIPILYLWNPKLFSLMGTGPNWSMFWILPWAMNHGSIDGLISGVFLGIILDSLNNNIHTQIPGLMLCGFWFGKLGSNQRFKNAINYGFLCSVGSFICGFFYLLQIFFYQYSFIDMHWLNNVIKNIASQVFLTGLLAPIFCSILVEFLDKRKNKNS